MKKLLIGLLLAGSVIHSYASADLREYYYSFNEYWDFVGNSCTCSYKAAEYNNGYCYSGSSAPSNTRAYTYRLDYWRNGCSVYDCTGQNLASSTVWANTYYVSGNPCGYKYINGTECDGNCDNPPDSSGPSEPTWRPYYVSFTDHDQTSFQYCTHVWLDASYTGTMQIKSTIANRHIRVRIGQQEQYPSGSYISDKTTYLINGNACNSSGDYTFYLTDTNWHEITISNNTYASISYWYVSVYDDGP